MLTTNELRVVDRIDEMTDEIVGFLQQIVRIPTSNPPGENYRECASVIGDQLWRFGYDIEYVEAEGLPECTASHPRVNVIGKLPGAQPHPALHFNGHLDVVPAGKGWSVDPFAGVIRDGKIIGRGVSDQKAGIAASIFAVEAIRRCGIKLSGLVEQSATVDEESGGFAGVAYLARQGLVSRQTTDFVIITEPLGYDSVCIGHRGVYWFEVIVRGKAAHGSMPFLGVNAIDGMAKVVSNIERELRPRLASRKTAMPVAPPAARSATLNINSIAGGQSTAEIQTPCVAESCRAIFDRRFLVEERFDEVRSEIRHLIESLQRDSDQLACEINDLMVVEPSMTPSNAPLVTTLAKAIQEIVGRDAPLIASPGTYDQKHFAAIAGINQCVAYGPGILSQAHQVDEYCEIKHLVSACKVMAIATMRLVGVH